MSQPQLITLATIAQIGRGKRPGLVSKEPTADCSVPVIGGGGVSGFTDQSIEPAGLLITGRVGTLGKLHFADRPCWPSDNALVLKPISDEIDQRFLQYAVASVISEAVESNRGAANPLITQKDLGNIKINLFSLPEQREIAGILGALDDKIELNRRIAATLEQMARSLYRSWFVDFDPVHAKAAGHPPAHMDKATAALFPDRFGDNGLPEGWRMGCLADVATNPRTCVKPEQIAPSTPYIGLEHMAKRSITLGDWVTAEDIGSQKSAMRQGDFLFGKLRPYFHKVGVSPVDGICSTDIVVVRAKSPEWEGFVLSVISSDEFVEHTNAGSSGTRMPRTNWGDMGRYQVILSPAPIAAAFEDMLGAFRRQIVAGVHENQTLATLRDSLLPRLMSGELRGNRSIATAANQAACS